jgi:DNA-directed RNA polymerase beta subunit
MISASKIPRNIGKPAAETAAGAGDPEFVPIGMQGVLASTEKLLAINRGLEDPDERDSYGFKSIWESHKHLGERIGLDAGHVRRGMIRNAAKTKSLRGLYPFIFDAYSKGLLLGDLNDANPLSSPTEEINPMHILEQSRRITQMGPGGIGSTTAITADAQNVHPSQFGFVCPISGPESEKAGVDARLSEGTRIGSDGRLYQQFKHRKSGKTEWLTPEDLETKIVAVPK